MRIFIGLLTLLFVTFLPVFAKNDVKIEIIYPKNGAKINATSVFIVGNTDKKACLTINDKPAKVYSNGAFVEITGLNKGINNIKIKAMKGHAAKEIDFTINVPFPEKTAASTVSIESLSTNAQITKDYAIIRKTAGGDRLTPLPSGTILNITGKFGDNYRFKYSTDKEGWISKNDVQLVSNENQIPENILNSANISSDENYVYIKLPITKKQPFLIEQPSENELNLKFFGAKTEKDIFLCENLTDFLKELKLSQDIQESVKLSIKTSSKQFWGYKYYYEENNFVLKLRKPPVIEKERPLKGKIICIDAGHGGTELGSVGPTGIPEKTINLAIAQNLKKILEKNGAKVIMTRDSDKYTDLYDRVNIANLNEAQILISIHNNALPDGKNPYIEHGTSTYYYHPQSIPLAKNIQQELVKTLGFNNLGILNSSFVLTRPYELPSILIEVGFMINPDEYNLLITPKFQKKAAKSIAKGLENFFLSSQTCSKEKPEYKLR